MTILRICGFESGNDMTMAQASAGTPVIGVTRPRFGTYALEIDGVGTDTYSIGVYGANGASGEIGRTAVTYYSCWFNFDTLAPVATFPFFCGVTNSAGTSVCFFSSDSSGNIYANSTASGGVGPVGTIAVDTWFCLKLAITSNATSSVQVNNGSISTFTADNVTQDRFTIGDFSGGHAFFADDFVLDDARWYDQYAIVDIESDGNGNYTAWTNAEGTTDERPHNGDTDFITSSTATQAETVAMESAATALVQSRPVAVCAYTVVRDEGGVSSIDVRMRAASTDVDSTASDPGSTYVMRALLRTTTPAGALWSHADINTLELGVLNNNSVAVRCTAIYGEVMYVLGGPKAYHYYTRM